MDSPKNSMRRRAIIGGFLLCLTVGVVAFFTQVRNTREMIFEPPSRWVEPAPMCPWREPEADRQYFFPGSNRHRTDTYILSSLRPELTRRLGRAPTPDEHTIYVHKIFQDQQLLGSIMTRRVKGESGAIEVVVAISTHGAVKGVRLQRLREPEVAATALASPEWLGRFSQKMADSDWTSDPFDGLPAEARPSARAIRDGIHNQLVLLDTAMRHSSSRPGDH